MLNVNGTDKKIRETKQLWQCEPQERSRHFICPNTLKPERQISWLTLTREEGRLEQVGSAPTLGLRRRKYRRAAENAGKLDRKKQPALCSPRANKINEIKKTIVFTSTKGARRYRRGADTIALSSRPHVSQRLANNIITSTWGSALKESYSPEKKYKHRNDVTGKDEVPLQDTRPQG